MNKLLLVISMVLGMVAVVMAGSVSYSGSVNAATPNPAAAQSEALSLYQQYLNLSNPQNQNQTQFQKASAAGGGDAFLPAGSTDWKPGSGFSPSI